jgi:hypothetical protein
VAAAAVERYGLEGSSDAFELGVKGSIDAAAVDPATNVLPGISSSAVGTDF